MLSHEDAEIFEAARPRLLGLAYRLLGSLSDAEDAVQDTVLKWERADRTTIEKPEAWLTSACTRRCIDMLRAAHRTRVSYVGPWLPEPIQMPVEDDTESKLELAQSLSTAFLLMLERLTPKERAAYLLHEIFEAPYALVAETLDMQESACRKLVSRAKANIGQDKVRHQMPPEQQDRFLAVFRKAVDNGTTEQLAALLCDDIRLSSDGGGKVPAARNTLHGKSRVLAFVGKGLRKYWAGLQWRAVDINGSRGVIIEQDGIMEATLSFAFDEHGKVCDIYIMRNPDKLTGFGPVAIH